MEVRCRAPVQQKSSSTIATAFDVLDHGIVKDNRSLSHRPIPTSTWASVYDVPDAVATKKRAVPGMTSTKTGLGGKLGLRRPSRSSSPRARPSCCNLPRKMLVKS